MKKALFGLQDFPGPWTFGFSRKTQKRDIFTFRVFGHFDESPLTGLENKKDRKFYKKNSIKKTLASPPLAPGGSGGGPPIPGAARN